MRKFLPLAALFLSLIAYGQADNEIQVYASPTIQHNWTIFELHSNYTFKGLPSLSNPRNARWTNETLEITHGFGKNFEIGFYAFSAFDPGGRFHYLGNQVRPRVTVPAEWNWKLGASLSAEFGFFRPHSDSSFIWQGELRPIIDKTIGAWYFSLNPNIDFVLSGNDKSAGIAPQFKTVYTIREVFGIGLEYYGALGTFSKIQPVQMQEHLIGPAIDLFIHPRFEFNAGFLFGLTDGSNQRVLKILLGKRIGK